MKNHLLLFSIVIFISSCSINSDKSRNGLDFAQLSNLALEESLIPIKQGVPNVFSFWNKYSKRFINVPAFNFEIIDGADEYKFIATTSDEREYSFSSANPWDNLSPIWKKLPIGYVDLEVIGLNKTGDTVGQAGTRKFYKAATYKGPYNKKVMDYDESAIKALKFLFSKEHIQAWKERKKPDTLAYNLYCYPAKIVGAVVESMIIYSELFSPNDSEALIIARNAADFLIKISEPEGNPLEYFPPTYRGNSATAEKYKNQFMLIYPAELAINYLNLYDLTGEKRYFNSALRIAKTYSKLQLKSGTWYLKLWNDGTAVKSKLCIPIVIIEFLERLQKQYGVIDFKVVAENALEWIYNNPVKTFDWSGQFEDINPSDSFQNLSKHEACSFSRYLFENSDRNSQNIKLAEELLRFSEDQFVVWEKPMPHNYIRAQRWITPCVLEQYDYYVPIDASASKLITTYLAAYQATNKNLYLLKALELGNSMTIAQISETGKYPTYWEWNNRRLTRTGWLNCTVLDIKAMLMLDKVYNNI